MPWISYSIFMLPIYDCFLEMGNSRTLINGLKGCLISLSLLPLRPLQNAVLQIIKMGIAASIHQSMAGRAAGEEQVRLSKWGEEPRSCGKHLGAEISTKWHRLAVPVVPLVVVSMGWNQCCTGLWQSGSHGKWPSVGLWKYVEEFIFSFETNLHSFYSNSSWNSADTSVCQTVREADSSPSLHKLSPKLQMAALVPHTHPTVP